MQMPRRKQIRIPGYDYTRSGAYFVTICTQMKRQIFGDIVDGEMNLNHCGQIAFDCWNEIPNHFPNIELGKFVIMPNHMHGILMIVDDAGGDMARDGRGSACHRGDMACDGRGSACRTPTPMRQTLTMERFGKPTSGSIPTIIRSYKSAVTNLIHKLPGFAEIIIWQRNYYEHIIRSDEAWARIDAYIESNPMNWAEDKLFVD